METRYLIWSYEHNAYWRRNSCGYTVNKDEAGRYCYAEAKEIVTMANAFGGTIKEAMLADLDEDNNLTEEGL